MSVSLPGVSIHEPFPWDQVTRSSRILRPARKLTGVTPRSPDPKTALTAASPAGPFSTAPSAARS